MVEMTLMLNSPITEEQFDALTDVDFDHTNRIYFSTKHGKEVEFVKRKIGKWDGLDLGQCTCCGHEGCRSDIWNGCHDGHFCPNCGAEIIFGGGVT